MEAADGPSDRAIIERVLAGEADAFGYLVRRYQNRYVRFAVRAMGTRDDAEDALQSAFMRAYRHLRSCHDPDRFGSWFYQIVINECRTLAVREARRRQRFTHETDDLHHIQDHAARADRGIVDDELQEVLNTLPPEQREAVLLRYIEDMSYEEMAALTGVGVSALKMRVKRAIARLRNVLDGVRHAG
jgi:RNA polymerase sigma-70 factor (ECF subfamily)